MSQHQGDAGDQEDRNTAATHTFSSFAPQDGYVISPTIMCWSFVYLRVFCACKNLVQHEGHEDTQSVTGASSSDC